MNGHRARKRFGQNFLTDQGVIAQIVDAISPQAGDPMVEIGPGLGALTRPLLRVLGALRVIELDRDLAKRWTQTSGLQVIQADVLNVDFDQIRQESQGKLRVVGNLPYNISSPILFHLLDQVDAIADQHFMLQKEVIDRMVAKTNASDYGRLSVMLQWRYDMTALFDVPPESFEPAPKVTSSVVRMVPRLLPADLDPEVLREMLKVAFSQRRKMLRHTLGPWLSERGLAGEIDLSSRAQELSPEVYFDLAKKAQTNSQPTNTPH